MREAVKHSKAAARYHKVYLIRGNISACIAAHYNDFFTAAGKRGVHRHGIAMRIPACKRYFKTLTASRLAHRSVTVSDKRIIWIHKRALIPAGMSLTAIFVTFLFGYGAQKELNVVCVARLAEAKRRTSGDVLKP